MTFTDLFYVHEMNEPLIKDHVIPAGVLKLTYQSVHELVFFLLLKGGSWMDGGGICSDIIEVVINQSQCNGCL